MNRRRPFIPFLAAVALVAIAPFTPAQSGFASTLIEGEVEPLPSGSASVGRAWFSLDPATDMLFYRVESDVVAPLGAALYVGPLGAVGAFVFPLAAAGPSVWQGATPALGLPLRAELFNSNLHVQIASVGFPLGDIRGQIVKTRMRTETATLTGLEAATPSPAVGTAGAVTLLPERRVLYRMTAVGLMAPPTVAHIHDAAGAIIATLTPEPGGAPEWCGVTPQLTTAQTNAIINGSATIDIHTVLFPLGLGEIRGHLVPQLEFFFGELSGAQAVPPNANPATSWGKFTYDPATGVLSYTVASAGAGAIGAHLKLGAPGVAGPVVLFLGAGAGPYVGGAVISSATAADLFFGRLYVEIDFPGAPIRGQVRQNPDTYGWGGPTAEGPLGRVLRILAIGPPTLGNPSFGVGVHDAAPGAGLSLGYAPTLVGAPLDLAFLGMSGHVLWEIPITGVPTVADSLGCGAVFFAIPAIPAFIGADFYFQWIAVDPGAAGLGLAVSNALHVTLQP